MCDQTSNTGNQNNNRLFCDCVVGWRETIKDALHTLILYSFMANTKWLNFRQLAANSYIRSRNQHAVTNFIERWRTAPHCVRYYWSSRIVGSRGPRGFWFRVYSKRIGVEKMISETSFVLSYLYKTIRKTCTKYPSSQVP